MSRPIANVQVLDNRIESELGDDEKVVGSVILSVHILLVVRASILRYTSIGSNSIPICLTIPINDRAWSTLHCDPLAA